MAKNKTSKKGVPRPRPKKEAGPNLFERLSNKKRFDVLGRNLKGETRHVGKLRTAAVEKRKSTLLVEYKQLYKTNAFIDRRFGEDDDTLTADERAILRFQKQRLREMSGSKFALPDEGTEEEPLTHLGRSLAELQGVDEGWGSDEDARLDDEMVRDLHFGGGIFERKLPTASVDSAGTGDGGEAPQRRRSKKEVMAEVMAKSKAFKAQKQQQREEDTEATDALDAAWRQLAQNGSLSGILRPKGAKAVAEAGDAAEDDKRFDVLTRELLYEGKAQPGERTLSPDELAEMERQRLESLEAQRLKRQRGGGGDDLEDDFGGGEDAAAAPGDEGLPAGGYALRRTKRAKREAQRASCRTETASDGSDSLEGSGSDEEGSDDGRGSDSDGDGRQGLEQRRQAAAAGSHPLQQAFRDASASLMAKYSAQAKGRAGDAAAETGGSDAEQEEEESEQEGSDSDGSGSPRSGASDSSSQEGEEEEEGTAGDGEEALPPVGQLSFTPPLPDSYPQFAGMAQGLSPDDLGELLRRIRVFNARALNSEGRKRLQVLYGIVAQHFSTLAGAAKVSLPLLDALLPHLLELTPLVPFYAATVHRARLSKAQQRLAGRLKDPLLRAAAWPPPRTLLLLKLLATLYPASDKRHPVLAPASLLACSALAQCPLARPRDVAAGLYLASVALHLHSQAKRFAPEPLNFAVSLLQLVPPARPDSATSAAVGGAEESSPRWLCTGGSGEALPLTAADIAPLQIECVLGGEGGADEGFVSAAFKTSAAAAAARLVRRCVHVFAEIDALPEILAPAREALHQIVALGAAGSKPAMANGKRCSKGGSRSGRHGKDAGGSTAASAPALVAPGLVELCSQVLADVDDACVPAAARRRPLCISSMVALPEARQFNPRFEEGFAAGKDYDPDRERSERRRLQRELRREERGAMRELRKDTAFMAGVRDRDRGAAAGERDQSAKRAMSFLQQQEADFKSGGQGGMWKKRKHK